MELFPQSCTGTCVLGGNWFLTEVSKKTLEKGFGGVAAPRPALIPLRVPGPVGTAQDAKISVTAG